MDPRSDRDTAMTAESDEVAAPPAATDAPGAAGAAQAARNDDVLERVRELLQKYPTIGSRQLYDFALRKHPDLEEAGFRSFHARYVLPLKRQQARAEGRPPKPRARTEKPKSGRRRRGGAAAEQATPAITEAPTPFDETQVRARVRDAMMRLAREVAVAESRADLVDALSRVETLVDEVMSAVKHTANN
jgi:hypothetical protein